MKHIKKISFVLLILMFFLPFLQHTVLFIKLKPLNGYFVLPKKPTFTYSNWLSGKFQDSLYKYTEHNIGFRSLLVRINNQIDFIFFKKTKTFNVVFGKDNVLFQDFYISSLWGDDFVGDIIIKDKVRKLAYIQQKLFERKKYLIFLIASGKASIYENNIPDKYLKKPKKINNYDVCVNEFKKNNINYIDIKSYFLKIKDTSSYPLFPKCGTHWSGYGLTLVVDTLFKYIEKISGYDLIDFHSEKGVITDKYLRFTDNDIGESLNLLWNIPNWTMYYPKVVFEKNANKFKPTLLSIGDSFNQSFWGFYPYFKKLLSNKSQFWYYFKVISWPEAIEKEFIKVEDLNITEELSKFDIILIVTSEHNLSNIGFGFIEKVYTIMKYPTYEMEIKIQNNIANIKSNTEWFDAVKKKAHEKGISIDEMLRKDAIWMIENE